MKRCTRCGIEKPMDGFPISKRMRSGRDSWCHECRAVANAGYRRTRAEKFNRERREDRERNPERWIWIDMQRRCSNPNRSDYARYGGRGIRVADEWLGEEGFARFLAHIGPRPSKRHSVDRYPNQDGNYEPGNVRWATQREQPRNFCRNRIITAFGRSQTLVEWAEEIGVSSRLIHQRIGMLGWTPEEALKTPVGGKRAA